jgi:hypothetical protein
MSARRVATRPWTDREVRVLRRDYGKPGHSLLSIGLDRTDHEVASKPIGLD